MYKVYFVKDDDEVSDSDFVETSSLLSVSTMSRSWFGSVGKFRGSFIVVHDAQKDIEATFYETVTVSELSEVFEERTEYE
jgi:hypothetical protein